MGDGYADYQNLVADRDQLREHNDQLKAEIDALRQQLAAMREQVPVAWRPKFSIEGDFTLGVPNEDTLAYWEHEGVEIEYAYIAAPVPPADVARDAEGFVSVSIDLLRRMKKGHDFPHQGHRWPRDEIEAILAAKGGGV